jgi:propionate CoA-transferase
MKLIQSEEICSLLKDGDTIVVTGITLGAFAEEAAVEIERNFLATAHPRDLTIYFPSAIGDRNTRGLNYICHPGLIKRYVGGHMLGCGRRLQSICAENQAEVYCFPQGVMSTMNRYIAAKKPGVITKIGLGTMMDPRQNGGRMNSAAKEDLVDLVELLGEEWLLYKLPKVDVTIIRGTVADEKGNISTYKEGYQLGQLAAAQAAKACGGIVICQVESIVQFGTLKPKEVKVPGILVDYIYTAKPAYHWQTAQTPYNPVFSGEVRIPLGSVPLENLSARKVIARRAAMELQKSDIVNLGVGIPEAVSSIMAEEGVDHLVTMTTEAGGIGGIPANAHDFGCCWNAECTLEMADEFDLYDGGTLDFGCLGFLQVAPDGSLNASMRAGRGIGVGGFMDVAAGAKKVIFTTIMTGGVMPNDLPQFKIEGGRISILREGNVKKFVPTIEQVTFNGPLAITEGKKVMVITERAVFQLTKEGLELIEIAPGMDLERDVLGAMDFRPLVSKNLQQMPTGIFAEHWGGLAELLT